MALDAFLSSSALRCFLSSLCFRDFAADMLPSAIESGVLDLICLAACSGAAAAALDHNPPCCVDGKKAYNGGSCFYQSPFVRTSEMMWVICCLAPPSHRGRISAPIMDGRMEGRTRRKWGGCNDYHSFSLRYFMMNSYLMMSGHPTPLPHDTTFLLRHWNDDDGTSLNLKKRPPLSQS